MKAPACPDDPTLARLHRAGVRLDEAEAFARHLETCAACQRRSERLLANDELASYLRHPRKPRLVADAAALNLIRRLTERPAERPTPDDEKTAEPPSPPPPPLPDGGGLDLTQLLRPPQGPDEIGRLAGYRVLRKLGSGGMGEVFLAEEIALARPVALKVMKPGVGGHTGRKRFQREAVAAAAVRNDHVVTLYNHGEDNGLSWLAMEFLEGETLESRIRREGPLPFPEILRIGREIALGLAAAHSRGLIHRDVKPSNVWLEAPRGRVKILDFGMARPVEDTNRLTLTGVVAGTPGYISYEQLVGQELDARTDLYSLGCVLYRMATGKPPYLADSAVRLMVEMVNSPPRPPRELRPGMPSALDELICRLLSREPQDRPGPAAAIAAWLETVDVNVVATMLPAPEPPAKKPRPRRWLLLAVVALLLGVLLGLLWNGREVVRLFQGTSEQGQTEKQ